MEENIFDKPIAPTPLEEILSNEPDDLKAIKKITLLLLTGICHKQRIEAFEYLDRCVFNNGVLIGTKTDGNLISVYLAHKGSDYRYFITKYPTHKRTLRVDEYVLEDSLN